MRRWCHGARPYARRMTKMLRKVRQIRQYASEPVSDDAVQQLLEVARWSGSSKNTQPWHFIVVTDREKLKQISDLRPNINWVAAAPLAIAIVLDGESDMSESYDEGRVTERLLIAAHRAARSLVTIGRPISVKDPRPNPRKGGRKPLSEIVSYEGWGMSNR